MFTAARRYRDTPVCGSDCCERRASEGRSARAVPPHRDSLMRSGVKNRGPARPRAPRPNARYARRRNAWKRNVRRRAPADHACREQARAADIEGAIYARRKALADLMHSQALGQGDIRRAVRQITETASQVLDVERASVWRAGRRRGAIECIDLYERSQARHSAGTRIRATDVPRYFAALQTRARDPRARRPHRSAHQRVPQRDTCSRSASARCWTRPCSCAARWSASSVTSTRGRARRWQLAEELLAGTFADFVALVLETAAWHEAEEALRVERDAIDSKVVERTRELAESEANLRALRRFLAGRDGGDPDRGQQDGAGQPPRGGDVRGAAARDPGAQRPRPLGEPGRARPLPGEVMRDRARRRLRGRDAGRGRPDVLGAPVRRSGCGSPATTRWWRRWSTSPRSGRRTKRCACWRRHDALTGIFNRRHVEELVRKELERAQRHSRPLTVAMMDADHFKAINDTHGHQVGDEVLRAIARPLPADAARQRRVRPLRRRGVRRGVPGDRPGVGAQRRRAAARGGRGGADHGRRSVAGP